MLTHDEEIIKSRLLRILVDDPTMILVLKNKYITNDLWRFCIEREPSLFKEMKEPNEEMCEFALKVDGYNLKYIRRKFTYIKITKKMAYIAISTCPKAILYVPDKILDDGLKEIAFDKEPSLMKEFKNIRPEFISKKVRENPSNIKYVNNPDDDLVCEALIAEPNICVYFEKLTHKMVDVLKEHHPNFLEIYQNVLN
jgi:hypothetical protein